MLSPNLWVPAVEQSMLIREFTEHVLDQAIRDCAGWPVATSVAVNLSARSLLDGELTATVSQLLRRYGLPPQRLILEITETVMMSSLDTVERIRAHAVVIVAQDTTEIELVRRQERVGGPLNDDSRYGLYVHPLLAMTAERVPLGVVAKVAPAVLFTSSACQVIEPLPPDTEAVKVAVELGQRMPGPEKPAHCGGG